MKIEPSDLIKTKQKHFRQTQFLEAFIESGGSKTKAIRRSGIPESTVHRWFAVDDEFKERVASEFQSLEAVLVGEAIQRALNGSEGMLKFLLSAIRPDRYDSKVRYELISKKKAAAYNAQQLGLKEQRELIIEMVGNDPMGEFKQLSELTGEESL